MSTRRDQLVRPEVVVDVLIDQQAQVAGDIVEVGAHTWAIHGVIPVDGDVLLAEFDSPQAAHAALDRLGL